MSRADPNRAIVVVGPMTITGPGTVDAERATVALDGIDEDLVLIEGRVAAAEQLWRDVLAAALGGRREAVLLCPSWWAPSRLARVEGAARSSCADVDVRRRVDVLAAGCVVVEVAPELIVVHADTGRHAVARAGPSTGVVGAVVACVEGLGAVTVDVPAGLGVVGAELASAVRRRGIAVTVVDDEAIVRGIGAETADVVDPPSTRRRPSSRAVLLAGAVASAMALTTAAIGDGDDASAELDQHAGTWLVEGRVAVEIPAHWTVQRVTSGPGSARVQVMSPSEASALQITQSQVPADQTLDTTAEILRRALTDEPDGVFTDLTLHRQPGLRPVVSYLEVRPNHRVTWTVMLDRAVRIAIGCQGDPGAEQACDRAIRSAHAIAPK